MLAEASACQEFVPITGTATPRQVGQQRIYIYISARPLSAAQNLRNMYAVILGIPSSILD